jgi:hypothetical protein
MQKLRSSDIKVKKLSQLILDSGLGGNGPIDEEICAMFGNFRMAILQIVKKFCTYHDTRPSDRTFSDLNAESKDYWVMHIIATSLNRIFFDISPPYGFTLEGDLALRDIYDSLIKIPAGELKEPKLVLAQRH